MSMLTTTVGACPKPDYVPAISVGQSHGLTRAEPTKAYDVFLSAPPADAEERFTRATREAVRDQVGAGIDVPTDGEIRREHYIYHHCRRLGGISFDKLSAKEMRDGSWLADVPTVEGPVAARAPI